MVNSSVVKDLVEKMFDDAMTIAAKVQELARQDVATLDVDDLAEISDLNDCFGRWVNDLHGELEA